MRAGGPSSRRGVGGYLLGAPATLAIVGLSVAVYIAQRLSGTWHVGSDHIDNVWHLLGYHRSAVLHGQVWRVFTPNLIHTIKQSQGPPGLGHLVFNMLTLLAFGPKAERIFGWRRLVALYVICGTVAYGWLLVANPSGQGVYSYGGGSSGSVFGVLGALLIGLWIQRPLPRAAPPLLVALLAYIGVQVYLAAATDIAGTAFTRELHGGGFLSGVIVGAAMLQRQRHARRATTPVIAASVTDPL